MFIASLGLRAFRTSLCRRFSAEETTRMKKALREFYRHVHPDILYQAPERVVEENQSSLKTLNNYLNSIEDNNGSKTLRLKFYTPEKTTNKNKKFLFFNVVLKPFKSNASQEEINVVKNNLAEELLNHLEDLVSDKVTKGFSRKGAGTPLPDGFVDINEIDNGSHPNFLKKNAHSRQEFVKLQDEINQAYKKFASQRTKDEVKRQIIDHITLIDPNINHKNYYASQIVNNLEYIKNEDLLVSNLFDPKLFLIDSSLDDNILFEFARHIDASENKWDCAQRIIKVVDFFTEHHPNIMIVIAQEYSSNDIPGWVKIKWNDPLPDMIAYLEDNMHQALENRYNFLDELEELEKITDKIVQETGIKQVDIGKLNTSLEHDKIFLTKLGKVLKRLINEFPNNSYLILRDIAIKKIDSLGESKAEYSRSTIKLPWNFEEEVLLAYLKNLAR